MDAVMIYTATEKVVKEHEQHKSDYVSVKVMISKVVGQLATGATLSKQ